MVKLHKKSHSKAMWAATTVGGAFMLVGVGSLVMQNVTPGFSVWSANPVTNSVSVSSGTIGLGVTGTLSGLSIANMAPGDSVEGTAILNNSGTIAFGTETVNVTDTGANAAAVDPYLNLTVQECSVAWAASGNTYTCSGTTTATLASTALSTYTGGTPITLAPAVSNAACTAMTSCATGGTDNLLYTVTLSSSAPSSVQGEAAAPAFQFNATQRPATTL